MGIQYFKPKQILLVHTICVETNRLVDQLLHVTAILQQPLFQLNCCATKNC